jgi:hypothetical protein
MESECLLPHLKSEQYDVESELIRHTNVINYIKAQILSWFGHLHQMPEERMVERKSI